MSETNTHTHTQTNKRAAMQHQVASSNCEAEKGGERKRGWEQERGVLCAAGPHPRDMTRQGHGPFSIDEHMAAQGLFVETSTAKIATIHA